MSKRESAIANWHWDLEDFGTKILKLNREDMGLNQAQMAERVGVSPSTISRLERGEIKPRNAGLAKHYKECYRVDDETFSRWCTLLYGTDTFISEEPTKKVKEADQVVKVVKHMLIEREKGNHQEVIDLAEEALDLLNVLMLMSPALKYRSEFMQVIETVILSQKEAEVAIRLSKDDDLGDRLDIATPEPY